MASLLNLSNLAGLEDKRGGAIGKRQMSSVLSCGHTTPEKIFESMLAKLVISK
jgi:hypothetical protein